MDKLLYRRAALEAFATAGWEVAAENACIGKAEPTPDDVVLEGARVYGLPVAETELEWCVLVANALQVMSGVSGRGRMSGGD